MQFARIYQKESNSILYRALQNSSFMILSIFIFSDIHYIVQPNKHEAKNTNYYEKDFCIYPDANGIIPFCKGTIC